MKSEKLDLNPEVLDEVQEAIYQARWVTAHGKSSEIATDRDLAQAAVEAVYRNLSRKFANDNS